MKMRLPQGPMSQRLIELTPQKRCNCIVAPPNTTINNPDAQTLIKAFFVLRPGQQSIEPYALHEPRQPKHGSLWSVSPSFWHAARNNSIWSVRATLECAQFFDFSLKVAKEPNVWLNDAPSLSRQGQRQLFIERRNRTLVQ
jgi:hypothetical protein